MTTDDGQSVTPVEHDEAVEDEQVSDYEPDHQLVFALPDTMSDKKCEKVAEGWMKLLLKMEPAVVDPFVWLRLTARELIVDWDDPDG